MPGTAGAGDARDPAPHLRRVSAHVGEVLDRFLAARRAAVAGIDESLPPLVDELAAVIGSGGKRVRPYLACWGYRAAGREVDDAMIQAAAALELLHTFALIQDDFMDASAVRRGRATTHATMGAAAALLVSDAALVWADELVVEAGFSPSRRLAAMRIFNAMRTEVTLGQYLDLFAPADEEHALKVNVYKTAGYTVLRPIQYGLVLGGAPSGLVDAIPAYAEPAGVAFQLRDDVLGAFGNTTLTGKPAGDDLHQRKATWLWTRALRRAGDPPPGTPLADWVRSSGALDDTEALIADLESQARDALAQLPVAAALREELGRVTTMLVSRTR